MPAPALNEMTRTSFLVDGFNLYHSLRSASFSMDGAGTRWLNLRALCESVLGLVGGGAELESVTYFSALAHHLESRAPETIQRHEQYLACLRATDVEVRLSHFKTKVIWCPECSAKIPRHEEKETDVAMATRIFELLYGDHCDVVGVITGDSDLTPAIQSARTLFPAKRVVSFFPFHRVSKELRQAASSYFTLSAASYVRHQLPDPFVTRSGRVIHKPATW